MREETAPAGRRGPFHGTLQIFRYNWTSYLFGALGCLVVLGLLLLRPWSAPIRWLLVAGGACAGFWLVSSLVVSYWVYDRSPLYRWDWIPDLFPTPPERWANLHVGLDETTPSLTRLFPGTSPTVLDLYDPIEMTEPSIRRARSLTPSSVPCETAAVTALPFHDQELDAVFLIFAAHEVRRPELRLQFFRELRRTLKPGGRLLIVEHLRDLPNFIAFGPGFLHFHSRREWLRLAQGTGFAVAREFRCTPFVAVFLLETPR
jgi:SAM-dependent methyltransferase